MAREEHLGFRCQEISTRHRRWGVVPACDLDFPLLHYHYCQVVALIELKYYKPWPNLKSASILALADLGTKAHVPAFVASYRTSTWEFEVYPINELGKTILGRTQKSMSEKEWVQFLHALRGREAPDQVLNEALDWPGDDWPNAYPCSATYSS